MELGLWDGVLKKVVALVRAAWVVVKGLLFGLGVLLCQTSTIKWVSCLSARSTQPGASAEIPLRRKGRGEELEKKKKC